MSRMADNTKLVLKCNYGGPVMAVFDLLRRSLLARCVQCWHHDENRVLALRLSNLGLQGQFPLGLRNCTSMTGLDLSANNFSGPIPSDIALQLPSLTSLDLSYNSFSGEIPVGISNLTYLNTLDLQQNQLKGHVPGEFSVLHRLESFNIADNNLSGPIPLPLMKFPASNFAGNQGLCGAPLLTECGSRSKGRLRLYSINKEYSIGAVAGILQDSWWPSTSSLVRLLSEAPSLRHRHMTRLLALKLPFYITSSHQPYVDTGKL